jgi:hypothetical protein
VSCGRVFTRWPADERVELALEEEWSSGCCNEVEGWGCNEGREVCNEVEGGSEEHEEAGEPEVGAEEDGGWEGQVVIGEVSESSATAGAEQAGVRQPEVTRGRTPAPDF